MRLALAGLALVLVLLAAPSAARADDPAWIGPPGATPELPLPPSPVTREVSYARQTLISDGIAAALVTSALLQDNVYSGMLLLAVGADVYAFGAPIVHFANRRVGAGFASMAMRVGFPLLGAKLGSQLGPKHVAADCDPASSCSGPDQSILGLLVGAGVGAVAAVIVDTRYLARKRVTEQAPPVSPSLGYSRDGFTLGLRGAF